MKSNNISIIILAIFSIFLAILLQLNLQKKADFELRIEVLEASLSNTEIALQNQKSLQFANWYQAMHGLKTHISVKNLENQKRAFDELIKGKFFIAHINSEMCANCIDKELNNIQLLTREFGKNKVAIFLEGYRQNYISRSEKFSAFKNQIFLIEENIFKHGEILFTPTITFLHNSNIKSVYHASKSSNESFETWFELVSEYRVD